MTNTTNMLLITLRSDSRYDARLKELAINCRLHRHDHEEVRDGTWSEDESERFHLTDELKEWGEWLIDNIADHFTDDSQAGFVRTLVRCAFDDVDWQTIAETYLGILTENAAHEPT